MAAYQKNNLLILCCFILLLWLPAPSAIAQSGIPTVACTVAVASMPVGGQTDLLLEIRNVQKFYGYELTLHYDPTLVEILDGDPNRDQVNAQLGDFVSQDFLTLNEINQPGALLLNLMQINPTPPRSGNGLLARIKVQGSTNGTVNFTLTDVLLYDVDGTEIPHEVKNCSLQIAGQSVPTPTATTILVAVTATATPTAAPSMTPTPTATFLVTPSESPTSSATPAATATTPLVTATDTPSAGAIATGAPVQETATFTPPAVPTSAPMVAAPAPPAAEQAAAPLVIPTATAIVVTPLPATAPATLADSFVPEATAIPSPTAPVTVTTLPTAPVTSIPLPGQEGANQASPLRQPGQRDLTIVLLWLFAVSAISLAFMLLMVYGLLARVQTPQPNRVAPRNRRRRDKMHRRSLHQQIR